MNCMMPCFRVMLKRFRRAEDGAAGLMWAILLPVVIGGVALQADTGVWFSNKRDLQTATDAAALAAVYDIQGAPQQSTMQATVEAELLRNGYDVNSGVTATVTYPPGSGSQAGNVNAVEVNTTQPQMRFFSRLAFDTDPTATARTVGMRQSAGSACVLALETIADDALLFQGNASINLANCVAAANSTNAEAIGISGSSTLSAESLYTAGGYYVQGSGSLNTVTAPTTGAPPLVDPYATLPIPSFSGCAQNNYAINNTVTLSPGVYCNGLDIRSQAVVTMNPGVYIIDRGEFKVNGGAVVTGSDVTIILTSSTGGNHATVRINGGATVTLSASTSGTYAGILFYQDQNAATGNVNRFNGGSTTNFTGALYFSQQEVQFTGNNSAGGGQCTKIVARVITFTGSSNFSSNCPASVGSIAIPGSILLVE